MAQSTPRHKLLRILIVSAILSIILFSMILYRTGSFSPIFKENNDHNTTLPHSVPAKLVPRIRPSEEIRKHIPIVRFHDPNEEPSEDSFRIAYLITVHNTDTIKGAVLLLDQLFDSKHTFIIHLDAKANNYTEVFLYQSLAKFKSVDNPTDPAHYSVTPQNNLIVLVNHPINWGGFGMIQATFDMLSAALRTGRWFDSVVLLSGNCHPVKPPSYIEKKLKELRGKLLLKIDGTGGSDDLGEKTSSRYDLYWMDSYYDAERLPIRADEFDQYKKNYPENLIRRAGTQWTFLSREFAEYVITSPWVKKLFVVHSTSYVPDESMFQLIANNSPFVNNTFTEPKEGIQMRYEQWKKHQAHPETLNEKSVLEPVQQSALFARKFPPNAGLRSFVNRLAQQMWGEYEDEDQ